MPFRSSSASKASCRSIPAICRKPSVELAKEWRKDRALRHLEALLIVADAKGTFLLSGNGDVIEPDDGLCAIGSGGTYALSAARALLKHSKLAVKDLAMEAMRIASEICIYTNANFTVEESIAKTLSAEPRI